MNMNKKAIAILIVAAVLLLGGWYYFTLSTKEAKEAEKESFIKVGGIFSLSGNGAAYGVPASHGMKLAVEEVNSRGGVSGKLIEAAYEDSHFQSAPALNAYLSLKSRGVRFFFTNGSQVATTLAPKIVENKDIQFETGAVTPAYRDGSPYTCRVALTADVAALKIAQYLVNTLKAQKVATLTLADAYGEAVRQEVAKSVQELGGEILIQESFTLQDADFRTQITKVKAKNPDALVVIPAAGQAETVFRQLKELGFVRPIISDNWSIKNQQLKDVSLVEGVAFSDYPYELSVQANDTEPVKKFKESYKQKLGQYPPVIAANAYDATNLLAQAVENAGSDPDRIAQYLSQEIKNYQGVSGVLSLDSDCEVRREVVIRMVRSGKFEKVE